MLHSVPVESIKDDELIGVFAWCVPYLTKQGLTVLTDPPAPPRKLLSYWNKDDVAVFCAAYRIESFKMEDVLDKLKLTPDYVAKAALYTLFGGNEKAVSYIVARSQLGKFKVWHTNGEFTSRSSNVYYGVPPSPEYELVDINKAIAAGHVIVLHGPRQSGKTTCLKWLSHPSKIITLETCRPDQNPVGFIESSLRNLLDANPEVDLSEVLKSSGLQAVCIDEFDALRRWPDAIEDCLRSIRGWSQASGLSFVCAGSGVVRTFSIDGEGSPWNTAGFSAMQPFRRDQVLSLLNEFKDDYGVTVDNDVLDTIMSLTNGQRGLVTLCGEAIQAYCIHGDSVVKNNVSMEAWNAEIYTFTVRKLKASAGYRRIQNRIETRLKAGKVIADFHTALSKLRIHGDVLDAASNNPILQDLEDIGVCRYDGECTQTGAPLLIKVLYEGDGPLAASLLSELPVAPTEKDVGVVIPNAMWHAVTLLPSALHTRFCVPRGGSKKEGCYEERAIRDVLSKILGFWCETFEAEQSGPITEQRNERGTGRIDIVFTLEDKRIGVELLRHERYSHSIKGEEQKSSWLGHLRRLASYKDDYELDTVVLVNVDYSNRVFDSSAVSHIDLMLADMVFDVRVDIDKYTPTRILKYDVDKRTFALVLGATPPGLSGGGGGK